MRKKDKTIIYKVPHYGVDGMREGVFELDKGLFNGVFSASIIHQAVIMYSANKRVGSASTKVRSNVSGGGKKPWRQKGTGRARVGSIRNPLWRGGGIVFGPHVRNFKYDLPKKIKRSALINSINAKISNQEFGVIKDFSLGEPRTKKFKAIIDKTKLAGTVLLVIDKVEKNISLASRNLCSITLRSCSDVNALDVLANHNVLISEKALPLLTKRIGG